MLLVVPADPLAPRRPDPHFAPEATAARDAGLAVAVVDHDLLERDSAADAVRRVPADEDVVYRGWMLTAAQYVDVERALADRGATLRTTGAQYRRAHELPGWYAALASVTPESCWTDGDDLAAFVRCCRTLGEGAAVLRDYSKSVKHAWHEAAYVPDVRDEAAASRVVQRLRELRDDAFTGGYVVRRFEPFVGAEARTWWRDGRCRLVTAHPDTPDELPEPDLAAVAPLVESLGLPFVTADLVRRDDGVWRLVELGDGQVSDRPSSCPAADLVAALA